jgi:hypothetical protein
MPKQKWDWLVIQWEEHRPRYANGQEIPNWQQCPTLFEVMNYLGWKGWEPIWDSSALWLGYLGYGKLTFRRLQE